MSTLAASMPVLSPNVAGFLRRQGTEADYQILCDIVRDCFPELMGIEAVLQQDPDEADRAKIVLFVRFPGDFDPASVAGPLAVIHERLVHEVGIPRCGLFGVVPEFDSVDE